ncbi:hypothetical protein [Streptomyces sp. G45]|uniref:hypothetical protein n=1 Tax=Streptomyces sp. G45 TaxID=3406627 RepID=UPI003C1BF862
MITTSAVGDWSWELGHSPHGIGLISAVETSDAVWRALAAQELALPGGKFAVTARTTGDVRDAHLALSRAVASSAPLASDPAILDAVGELETLKEISLAEMRVQCSGLWLEPSGKHRAERLFSVQVDIWKNSLVVVSLETYSDAWMTMDLREREQVEVHALNAPRLAAALAGVSALLGRPPTPGDPTPYATPTKEGFEDLREEGAAYPDPWATFEVPARSRRLRALLPADQDEYLETTDHAVRYYTIQREGRTLGYVWASVADNAAGYEPRSAAGDDAFAAGAAWLTRLRDAHGRGLTALAALDWLTHLPPLPDIGTIAENTPREASSLDALEELSGRY